MRGALQCAGDAVVPLFLTALAELTACPDNVRVRMTLASECLAGLLRVAVKSAHTRERDGVMGQVGKSCCGTWLLYRLASPSLSHERE